MKNKLRKLLRFGLTSFAIGLLLTNCEKDSAQEETISVDEQEPTLTLKHYSKTNIEKNTKLVSRLKEFNNELIKNKSAKQTGKNVYNKEYDFTIYTDSATYIQNGDYHSYTFPIIQGADDKITNVMFELNDQNEYDAYLVNYDYSANELKYKDFKSLSMKTSIKPLNLSFSSLFSKTKTAYVCVYSYEYVRTGSHFTNGDSNLIEFDYGWVLTAGHCETVLYYDEDYKEYHEGNTATITIGGTTYGGTGGSTTSPTPSPFDSEELIKIDIVKNRLGLNHPERLWIDKWENGQYAFQLYDLLKINSFSAEAIEFGNNAIEALMVGQEFDFIESFRSPFNVDLSGVKPDVDPNTTERDKEVFMNVYNKLIETTEFKKLFIDVFGEDSRFTVKFEIQDNLQCGDAENPNGCTTAIIESVDGNPTSIKNNLITISIDKTHLETSSFIDIAKTIIHEAIHANITLLQVKDKSLALPLTYSHSADTFAYILKERFNNDDHIFMANYYIPTMSAILKSVMPLLYSPERIQQILDRTIIDMTGSGLGELEKFNFEHFYEHYPWSGLHKTSEFAANFVIQRDYALYIGYVLIAREFGH